VHEISENMLAPGTPARGLATDADGAVDPCLSPARRRVVAGAPRAQEREQQGRIQNARLGETGLEGPSAHSARRAER
jgi:hypothetical protein